MRRLSPHDYHPLLHTGRWFAALPDALQTRLLDDATIHGAVEGERIVSRGDESTGVFAVVDGAVRMSGGAGTARDPLYMIIEPPSWFGELSMLDGLPCQFNATAAGASELIHVPQDALDAILAAEPRYWREFARLTAQRHRFALMWLDTMQSSPLIRTARRLMMMISGYGDHTLRRRSFELSQEQLAMMVNLSRQTANQLLKELEALGLVKLAYGEIEIIDAAALYTLAAFQPPVPPGQLGSWGMSQ